MKIEKPSCDLCGDNGAPVHLHARCHMTAPLRASLHNDVLTLSCYIPTCGRPVASLRIAEIVQHAIRPTTSPVDVVLDAARKVVEHWTAQDGINAAVIDELVAAVRAFDASPDLQKELEL